MIDINRIVELFNAHVNNKDNYKYYVLVLLGAAVCILIYSYHKKMNSSLKELENKMNNKFEIILYDNIEQIKSSMKDENDKLIKMIENNNEITEVIENIQDNDDVIESYSNEHNIPLVVESSITQTENNNEKNVFTKNDNISINDDLIIESEQSVLSFNKLMQYKLDKLRNIAEEMDIELNINNKKKTKKQLANDIIEHQSK
jgi:hypothetical protein